MSAMQYEAWEEIESQYLLAVFSQKPHSLQTTHLIAGYV